MREPVLQDKRQEHVKFQQYGLELLQRVSGRDKSLGNEFDVSLAKIKKADVVAKTRIQFNEKQLLQLIHQHLLSKNMVDSAAMLIKEAGLPPLPVKQTVPNFPPYRTNSTPATPSRSSWHSSPQVASTPTNALTPSQPSGLLKLNLSAKYVHHFSNYFSLCLQHQQKRLKKNHKTEQNKNNLELFFLDNFLSK